MGINRGRKRPVFDEKLDNMESQVKLGKLGQQEIDKEINEGERRPNFKTNGRRTKKIFTPIPPDRWERIERRRAVKRKSRGEEDKGDDEKLIKLDPKRPNLKTNRKRIKKLFTPIPPDRWDRIPRRRAVKRKSKGEEDEEERDDEKIIKLDPAVNLKELPFYLPPTLRGKKASKKGR